MARQKGSVLIMNGGLSLRNSYLLLIVLAIIFSGLSFVFRDEWFRAYFSNIAAGVVGSLFVIFFVDRIIERNREKERLRVVRVALQRLRFPILWHMTLLCNIYKAATKNKPTPLPTTFEDTFTDNYYKEISFLDFSKDAGVAVKRDWFTHLDLETKFFKEKLEQVIDTYAVSLDVALIETLERIINSHFVIFIPQIRMTPTVERQHKFRRDYYAMFAGMEQIVKEHVSNMLELLEYFNAKSDSPIQLIQGWWGDRQAPTWGSARLEMHKEE